MLKVLLTDARENQKLSLSSLLGTEVSDDLNFATIASFAKRMMEKMDKIGAWFDDRKE